MAGTTRRRRQDRAERGAGRREDQSSVCVRRTLEQLHRRLRDGAVYLQTDHKTTYGDLARALFGERLRHETTPSTLHRGTHNPLFPINTTMAMTRDNMGRMRRRSWLVSKKHEQLRDHAGVFLVYRNYVRKRFNRDGRYDCPARLLGLQPRPLTGAEVVAWRQDWGAASIHPMSYTGRSAVGASLPTR